MRAVTVIGKFTFTLSNLVWFTGASKMSPAFILSSEECSCNVLGDYRYRFSNRYIPLINGHIPISFDL
jgi:hypothetical protein